MIWNSKFKAHEEHVHEKQIHMIIVTHFYLTFFFDKFIWPRNTAAYWLLFLFTPVYKKNIILDF